MLRYREVSGYLVGSAAFKAVGMGDPHPAGSIPVHLRYYVHGCSWKYTVKPPEQGFYGKSFLDIRTRSRTVTFTVTPNTGLRVTQESDSDAEDSTRKTGRWPRY